MNTLPPPAQEAATDLTKLRVAIAEKVGWRILTMREACEVSLYTPTPEQDQDAWQFLYSPDNKKQASTDFKNKKWGSWVNMLPDFGRNNDAAISLCDWMRERGCMVGITALEKGNWACSFSGNEDLYGAGTAPTFALAVSLAFAKANNLPTE